MSKESVVSNAGYWLMEENPGFAVAPIRDFVRWGNRR